MNRPFQLFRPVFFAFGLIAALAAPLYLSGELRAQDRGCRAGELCIDLNPRNFKPMPIAIVDFSGDPQGIQLAEIMAANLKRSGVFEPIDKARHPERSLGFDQVPNFAAWQQAGAQAIVSGRVVRDGARLAIEYRLWDATTGKQVVGQKHAIDPANWRRLAHLASDAVFERMTGETGFFDTRIIFVDETGPKEKRRKRLAIIDQDGANFRALSSGSELLITPRFSPRGDRVAFMSLEENGRANVQVLDLGSGRRAVVGSANTTSFAPRFAPNGTQIVMSVENGGNTNLALADIGSGGVRPLTSGGAIDTSPSFSPDGSQIAFESDRGGGQQIYIMGADGSGARRISFGEGRYSTPVWSPKGDFIAFTRQKANSFAIGVMKPDGSGERILTEGYHNEGPTWAPNGRYIMFFRDSGAGPKLHMVDVNGRIDVPIPTPAFASDPAWSPLLSTR
ncbi:MAG: Tol-Pal system beta propeller repeat protein TolB [Beijerinckiaceae bacterium]|nr:Tol-Pal system beta propeller repeat protein TolB [Beijerinckiaceae bacterium]